MSLILIAQTDHATSHNRVHAAINCLPFWPRMLDFSSFHDILPRVISFARSGGRFGESIGRKARLQTSSCKYSFSTKNFNLMSGFLQRSSIEQVAELEFCIEKV